MVNFKQSFKKSGYDFFLEVFEVFPWPLTVYRKLSFFLGVSESAASSGSGCSPDTKKIVAEASTSGSFDSDHKDNSLREFRRLCADISNNSSYLDKTAIVKKFITKGSDGGM